LSGVPRLSSSEIYDWTHTRARQRMKPGHRHSVRRILRTIADPVGRASTIGRPWLWRLKDTEG
jgi:hypothetical protein